MLAPLPTERKALLDAADLIERRGLAKYELQTATGALCAIGAMNFALTGRAFSYHAPNGHDTRELFRRYLQHKGYWAGLISDWNNHRDRTKEEVVNALRGAATFGL